MKYKVLLFATVAAFGLGLQERINAQCVAGYDHTVTGLSVQFTNEASGGYDWITYDYGDGTSDFGVTDPTHVYAEAGVYLVFQFIQDSAFTCVDFYCDTVYVGGATCQVDFYLLQTGLEVTPVSFSLGQYDGILWDFGDGTTSTDTMPLHVYSLPGTYSVCLSLFDGTSLCDSTCQMISVDSMDCAADFTYSTTDLTVDFTNTSSGSFTHSIWDFGDGTPGTNALHPSHTYAAEGLYEACLTVYDTNGTCFSEFCEEIAVGSTSGDCEAHYTYETNGLFVQCTNTSVGAFNTAVWDFGDGSTPGLSGNHTYSAAGDYEICLTIANAFPSCIDDYCETVPVSETTGTDGRKETSGFSVYPNPSDGAFHLVVPASLRGEQFSIQVVDLSGRTVTQHVETANAGSVDLNLSVPAGVYYLQVTTRSSGSEIIPILVR